MIDSLSKRIARLVPFRTQTRDLLLLKKLEEPILVPLHPECEDCRFTPLNYPREQKAMLKLLKIQTVALTLFASAALLSMTTENAAGQSAQRYVQVVDYEIAPAQLEKFMEALKENGAATIKEAGCLQLDMSQSASNPNQILIYEVYENEAAVQAHRASDHFKKYVATTKDMFVNRQIKPIVSVVRYSKAN